MEQAPVKKIFSKPLHPYTKGLLAAIPRITKDRPPLETIEGSGSESDREDHRLQLLAEMSVCHGVCSHRGTAGGTD